MQQTSLASGRASLLGRSTAYARPLCSALLAVQGIYYFGTGIWPLISIETFQMVTGPKTDHMVTGREADHWLVMTVGVLIVAIAIPLLIAALRGRTSAEIVVLALGSALGLTAIDVIYVARQVIPPIYLVDAVAEIALIGAWFYAWVHEPAGTQAVAH